MIAGRLVLVMRVVKGFAWQHVDLLTKGKHTVGCSYSRGDVTPGYLTWMGFFHVRRPYVSLNENVTSELTVLTVK